AYDSWLGDGRWSVSLAGVCARNQRRRVLDRLQSAGGATYVAKPELDKRPRGVNRTVVANSSVTSSGGGLRAHLPSRTGAPRIRLTRPPPPYPEPPTP